MKKIQKNLRGSFNVFSNSARQLEVPLKVSSTFLNILVLSWIVCLYDQLNLTYVEYVFPLE